MDSTPDLISQTTLQLRLVIGSMMGGTALYLAVILFVAPFGAEGSAPASDLISPSAFVVMAIVVSVLQLSLPSLITARPFPSLERYRVSVIVAAGIREGLGLVVLTLAMLAGSGTWALVFGLVTLGTMSLGWPKTEDAHAAWRAGQ